MSGLREEADQKDFLQEGMFMLKYEEWGGSNYLKSEFEEYSLQSKLCMQRCLFGQKHDMFLEPQEGRCGQNSDLESGIEEAGAVDVGRVQVVCVQVSAGQRPFRPLSHWLTRRVIF